MKYPHVILNLVFLLCYTNANIDQNIEENINGEAEKSNDMDLYNTNDIRQNEFRLIVPAGGRECFYEKVLKDDLIFTNFQTLTSKDNNVGFAVKSIRDQKILYAVEWEKEGYADIKINQSDVIQFCFNNIKSPYNQKNVQFYVILFIPRVFNTSEHTNITDSNDVEPESDDSMEESMMKLDERIVRMVEHQAAFRSTKKMHTALQIENNDYIQWRALFQITIIIVTGTLQVLFVKRLFNEPTSQTGKTKIRA